MSSLLGAAGRRFWLAAAGAVLVSLLGPASLADEIDNVLVMRAADLESQGRCAEAVEVYRGSDRQSAHLALIAGRCQVRTKDYAGAVDTLDPARNLPDASPEVDLYLGVSEYHLGLLDDARASLDRAKARGEDGALLELYTGLLKLQGDDARGAALALERARRADSRAVEPVASYYAWVAWRNADDEERAEAALARVREQDPDGPWIAEAERVLAGEPSETPNFWLNAEAGLEYDSNVTIRGGGVNQVFINGDTVSGKDDGRGIWTLDGGSELFRNEKWSGGVLGAYTGTANFDISEFDAHYPVAGTWLDHHFGPQTTLRGRYDFGYAWVNYDPYVLSNVLSATLFQGWDEAGNTELTFSAGFYDFKYDRLDPTPGDPTTQIHDIDQDGTGLSVELLHRVEVGFEDLEARAGYRYTNYDADGGEFDYNAHRFLAGFDLTLPFEVMWDSWGAFTYQPYRHTSVYAKAGQAGPTHRDRVWEFGTEFEKFVTEDVSVLARYRFIDTGSNTDVYDYDRHVVGAYVRIRFR
jgi:hypothetical protein